MEPNEKHIQSVSKQYEIEGNISNISYLIEVYEEGVPPRAKVIVRPEMDNRLAYIIKFVLKEEHSIELIEEQSIFSECMRRNKINTAKRYKSCNKYCISYPVDGLIYAVVYSFWWTRIIFDEEKSLKKYLDERNVKKVNEFFNETYNLLSQDYFI